jgi:hypothetical protein
LTLRGLRLIWERKVVIDVESYCRDIEAYLCRKNDGHLIRVTGLPSSR